VIFIVFAKSTILFFSEDDYEVINVDAERPERNREVYVYKFTDVMQDGILHDGFDICYNGVDFRDFRSDKLKLEIVSSYELLLTIPSMSHWNLHESGKYFAHLETMNELCNRTKQSHDVARNAIRSDEKRMTKYLLLRFPENYILSTRFYSEHPTELHCKLVPLDTSLTLTMNNNTSKKVPHHVNVLAYWKVSVKEVHPRVVESTDDAQTKGEKELSKIFSRMSV
jgi:hypothetical protein